MEELKSDLQEFLKALSGETRQKILFLFFENRRLSVNEVALKIGIGQSTVSEHLTYLKRVGVLASEKEGKNVFYYTDKKKLIELLDNLRSYFSNCC